MKILVVGTGSIGTRHLKNLKQLGHELYAVDTNPKNLRSIVGLANGVFDRMEDGLRIHPDIVFVCTYSNSHIPIALLSAREGCHLFIEKPLSLDLKGASKLVNVVKKNKLITMVGCNMRFHPAIGYIKDTLNKNQLFKKRLWANLEFGYYLPFAKKNYEDCYQSNRNMGGNLIFDCIHELDYAVWFFGRPREVFCTKGIVSRLKIDTEDCVDMIIRFYSGTICTIHMDYLQHGYSRHCKIVCEDGTLFWDFNMHKVDCIAKDKKKWSWKDTHAGLSLDAMYKDEIRYFIESIQNKKQTFNSIEQSMNTINLAIAAERSCGTKKWEPIKENTT